MSMNIAPRAARLLPALGLAVLLAGCGNAGVGEGNRVESLKILKLSGVLGPSDNRVFVCFRDALQLVGTFTDGLLGDFTNRATWSSSNPAVVEVSNGDIFVPGDTVNVFVQGTLIPRAEGSATITATFLGLQATFDVVSKRATSINVTPAAQTMGPNTVQQMQAVGVFDGYTVDVTTAPEWSIVNEDEDVATIASLSGLVRAVGVDPTPRTVRAKFLTCETPVVTDPANSRDTAEITVALPQSITAEREFTGSNDLIIGTSDSFAVTAHFEGGVTQDLSGQARLLFVPDAIASLQSNVPTIVRGLAAGTVQVTPCYDPEPTQNDADTETDPTGESCNETDPNRIVGTTPVTLNVVAATLNSIAITPQNPTVTGLGTVEFHATGSYDNGARTQDITRHVTWSSSDTSIAVVSNNVITAGLAFALRTTAGTADITATQNEATVTKTATTKLCVYPPEVEARPCPP